MKKNCYLLITLILAGWGVKSQPPAFSCTSAYYCSLDLRNSQFLLSQGKIDSLIDISYSKSPVNTLYRDVEYTGDCENKSDNCNQDINALKFDVYFPKNTAYTHYDDCPLPMVVMVHGGAFTDCSTKNAEEIKFICRQLAERGFIVFNVDYRGGKLTYPGANSFIINRTKTVYQQLAVYRAIQDIRGALKRISKKNTDHEFDANFKADLSKLFIGGQSAGAGTVLSVAYLQDQWMVDQSSPGIAASLGSIDPDYYAAPYNYSMPAIKGVFSMWGDFPMPGTVISDADQRAFFVHNGYMPPLIAFHGMQDDVVKYTKRFENFPTSTPINGKRYDQNSYCLDLGGTVTLTHTSVPLANDLNMIGSIGLQNLLQYYGKIAEVHLDCTMGHGLDGNDGVGSFFSDFGTGLVIGNNVRIYMVQRAACFFQSIITGNNITGTSIFTECPNTRNSCAASSTDVCHNYDTCPGL